MGALGLSAALAYPARADVLAWVPTSLVGVDVVDLLIGPDSPARVRAGTAAAGVFESRDGGATFEPLPVALPATRLLNLAVDPGDPGRLYASTDRGLFRLEGDGTWRLLRPPPPDGALGFVAVDPSAPGTIVVSAGLSRLERSTDFGATWTVVRDVYTASMISRIVFDPSGSGVVLATEFSVKPTHGLLRSTDHGATWTLQATEALSYVTFDPFGSGSAFAIRTSYPAWVSTLVRSRDGGLSWEPIAPSSNDARGPLTVPRSGAVLAAGSGDVLLHSGGAGSPWVEPTLGAPGGEARRLAALDTDGTSLLLATSGGLFRTVRAPDPVPCTTFLPAIVDAFGEAGTRFRTSVALFNASDGMAKGTLAYEAAGSVGAAGSGTIPLRLGARQQLALDDAAAFLRSAGLGVPEAGPGQPQVGTLTVRSIDGVLGGQVVALARVTTPSGPGSSGTGIWAFPSSGLLLEPSYLPGLRQNAAERTNVAVANAGVTGTIRLRVTVFDAAGSIARETELGPGQWTQWNAPLAERAVESADVVVERIEGTEPYAAYATIVDGVTGDGSYLPARGIPADGLQWIPAVVEAGGFETEVVVHNPGSAALTVSLAFTDSLGSFGPTPGPLAPLLVALPPRGTVVVPRFGEALRSAGIAVGPRGVAHAGTLLVDAHEAAGASRPVLAWARTSIAAPGGGSYGVAYPSLAAPDLALNEAWVAGLTTNSGSRANLALLNPGSGPVTLEWRAFSGSGSEAAIGGTVALEPGGWSQEPLSSPLLGSNVVVRVRKVAGKGPFAAYGIVNDGTKPGEGTGDGSYLPMQAVR